MFFTRQPDEHLYDTRRWKHFCFVHRGRQNQDKMKDPFSCLNIRGHECVHDRQLSLDLHKTALWQRESSGNIYNSTVTCTTTVVCVNLHADLFCVHVKCWTKCLHIILYGSSVSLTVRHFPVACFHSLAEVLCVSEARAGAESLMDGVQGSRTSAVAGHITTQ